MASNLETRLWRVEGLIKPIQDALQQLRDKIAQLKQQQYGLGGGPSGGGGGAGGVYFADHLNIGGTSGLLTVPPVPASAPGVHVYQIVGGGFTLVTSSGAVYNGLPDPTDSTKRQILMKNTDGTYSITGQSCISP